MQAPRWCHQATTPEQLLATVTLVKELSVEADNTELLPTDSNDASGGEQELVCPDKDLELLAAGAKHLLAVGAKELLESA